MEGLSITNVWIRTKIDDTPTKQVKSITLSVRIISEFIDNPKP